MALKTLMLKRKLDEKKKLLEAAREKQEQQKNDGGQAGPQGGPGQDGQDSQQNQENQDYLSRNEAFGRVGERWLKPWGQTRELEAG